MSGGLAKKATADYTQRVQYNRPAIAVFLETLNSPLHNDVLLGVADSALKHDYNVVAVTGCAIDNPTPLIGIRNHLFDLVNPDDYVGLIVLSSSLARHCGQEKFLRFLERFRKLKIVCIGDRLSTDFGLVKADYANGIAQVVRHLHVEHGRRNIALIRGQPLSKSSQERHQAYLDTLKELGEKPDPEMVVYADLDPIGGYQGINELLDKRKKKIDAVITLTDRSALRVVDELRHRGFSVPDDVAVVGFQGRAEGMFTRPGLTTVDEHMYDQGVIAFSILEEMLAGKEPREAIVPTRLVVRGSCGCHSAVSLQSFDQAISQGGEQVQRAIGELQRFMEVQNTLLSEGVTRDFEEMVHTRLMMDIFSRLGEHPEIERSQSVNLLGRFVNFVTERASLYNGIVLGKIIEVLRQMSFDLASGYSLDLAVGLVAEYLKIRHCYVSFYDDGEHPPGKWYRLMVEHRDGVSRELPPGGEPYLSTHLLPEHLMTTEKPFCGVVEPLCSQTKKYGFVMFDLSVREGIMYEVLQILFSNAVDMSDKADIIRKAEQRFADIALSSSDWLWETDSDFRFVYCSEGVETVLGWTMEEMLGRTLFETFASWDNEVRSTIEKRIVRQLDQINNVETWHRSRRSRDVCLQLSCRPMMNPHGEFLGYRGVYKDVTQRKKAEEAIKRLNARLEIKVAERTKALEKSMEDLKRTQAQLIENEKMAALGNLVAGIAHEINTPVGIGVTAASFLEDKAAEIAELAHTGELTPEKAAAFARSAGKSSELILHNLRRAVQLINSFKLVAVDQSVEEKRIFSVQAYFREILISLQPEIRKKGHQVQFDCPEEIEVFGYPGAFTQILSNLIMNSLVHAFDEGVKGQLTLKVVKTGEALELDYSDNGKGMTPDILARVFEPFFTTRRGAGGSGLGMHIIYNLVTQKLKGTIRCSSSPGSGSRFIIRTPLTI